MSVSDIVFEFGPFQFDPELLTLTREGRAIKLSPKAADLLERFVTAPGKVLSKDQLLTTVWPGTFVEEGTLAFHVHALRRALADEAATPRFIQTVPRRGYRFIVAVQTTTRDCPVSPVLSPTAEGHGSLVEADPSPHDPSFAHTVSALQRGFEVGRRSESQHRPIRIPVRMKATPIAFASALGLLLVAISTQAYLAPVPVVRGVRRLSFDQRIDGDRFLELGSGRLLIDIGADQFVLAMDGRGHLAPSPFKPFHFIDVSRARGEALANRLDDAGDVDGLWIVPLAEGHARRVGEVRTNVAAWSHDGRWIAFTDGQHALYVTDPSGTAVRQLATFGGGPASPLWSPSDKVIRLRVSVRSDRQFRSEIMEVPFDGSGSPKVFQVAGNDVISNGGWLSDGDYLYCGKTNLAGCLTMTQRDDYAAAWMVGTPLSTIRFQTLSVSPDGRRIYGTVRRPAQLSRYDAVHQAFVPYLGGIDAFAVEYAHHGHWMVYITEPDERLWQAAADGTHARPLTFGSFHVDAVAISPNDETIAVRGAESGRHRKIFLMPALGGPPQPIAVGDVEQGSPTWSPDGMRIAFGDVPETYGIPSGNERLHIYNLQSHHSDDVPESIGFWSSRWSPDGRYLAATTIAERALRLFDFETRTWRSYDLNHVDSISWSRDSKYLFCDPETGVPWRRVLVPDGTVDNQLTVTAFEKTDGGVAEDGSALFLVSRSDVYELDVGPERCGLMGLIRGCRAR